MKRHDDLWLGAVVEATEKELERRPKGKPNTPPSVTALLCVIEASPNWVVIKTINRTRRAEKVLGAGPATIGYLRRCGCEIKRTDSATLARWPWQRPTLLPLELRPVWDELTREELQIIKEISGIDIVGAREKRNNGGS